VQSHAPLLLAISSEILVSGGKLVELGRLIGRLCRTVQGTGNTPMNGCRLLLGSAMGFHEIRDTGTRYGLVAFDSNGIERPEFTGKFSQMLVEEVTTQPVTNVLFFSHGWKGDVAAATEQYGPLQTTFNEARRNVTPETLPTHVRDAYLDLNDASPWDSKAMASPPRPMPTARALTRKNLTRPETRTEPALANLISAVFSVHCSNSPTGR
jgi:hypothetical protein